jgi:hypothetical protein
MNRLKGFFTILGVFSLLTFAAVGIAILNLL